MVGKFAIAALAVLTTTTSYQVSALPNWIGKIGSPTDTACYRKSYLTKQCPLGYQFDNIATCWAECPLEYPVECAWECIPQSADCALEIIGKVQAVADVAIYFATSGVVGDLSSASKGVQQGVACGVQLFSVVSKLVEYAKELEKDFPDSTQDQLLYLLSKSDFAIYDLPVAVITCLGISTPSGLEEASKIAEVVTSVLKSILSSDGELTDINSLISLLTGLDLTSSITDLSTTEMNTLTTTLASNTTCGDSLNSLINKLVAMVIAIKDDAPDSTVDAIRFIISNSDLFLVEIPAVTNNCMSDTSADSYDLRDQIRKAFETIVENIIGSASSSNGTPLSSADYYLSIIDKGLSVIAMFDPSGIAALAAEYIQPICGPTSFLGEIDDGTLTEALGLTTEDDAFAGSYGTWTKTGDGVVKIFFESTDTQDVTVNIYSGGDQIKQVKVAKGTNVTWTSTVSVLQDKTLYLDRWRPGLIGIPGTGGGSLLQWIPHTSTGGHLELHAKLNVS